MTTIATYEIPEQNLDALRAKLAKLNKRAAKIGVAPVTLVAGEPHDVTIAGEPLDEFDALRAPDRVLTLVPVTLEGETPKYAGWTFGAVLTHTDAGVIVSPVPGVEIPTSYRVAPKVCEHCGIVRDRHETFVLINESGETKQVGSSCIKDFLGGANPHEIANAATRLIEFTESTREEFGGRGYVPETITLDSLLPLVALVIRHAGWLSVSKAREYGDRTPTVGVVYGLFGSDKYAAQARAEWLRKYGEIVPSDEDKALAAAAIEWAKTQQGQSDYEHNLRLVAQAGKVLPRTSGIAASMIIAYRKATEQLVARVARPESHHVGTIGERRTFTLTVVRVRFSESEWGTKTIIAFTDEQGNDFTWFASGVQGVEVGQTFAAKATVKEHSEYQGRPQTIIARVALGEPLTSKVGA